MTKGDIILVPFPFTDLMGNKLRPALVLMHGEKDVTVAFITTQLQWKDESDIMLQPTRNNGLKTDSLIRLSKLATVDKDLIFGKLGQISDDEIRLVNRNLIVLLKLQ